MNLNPEVNNLERLFSEIADRIYTQGDEVEPSLLNALCNIISSKKRGEFILRDKVVVDENFSDKNIQYYNHYCNLYIANVMLLEKIKDTLEHKEELIQKLKRLRECSEQVLSSLEEKNINKKKRHRRPAKDIDRHFTCPILKCDKSYGSEGSLNQHIKQKHRKYWNKYCCGKSVKDGVIVGQSVGPGTSNSGMNVTSMAPGISYNTQNVNSNQSIQSNPGTNNGTGSKSNVNHSNKK